jgi:hypothetical protein
LAAQAAEDLGHRLGLSEQDYGTVGEQVKALTDNIKTGSSTFVDYGDLIQRSQNKTKAWAEQESKDKYKSKDSWQEWYDGVSVNINDFATVLQEQIDQAGQMG